MKLVLASNSPRRKELLNKLNLKYTIKTEEIEESWEKSFSPISTALSLAYQKGYKVAVNDPENLILSADTIVVLGGKIIGKPRDKDEARNIISSLSGKTHCVITAFSLISIKENIKYINHEISKVKFRDLKISEIETYIQSDEPYDKAGAYAIQGQGSKFVDYYTGDLDNIIGLPRKKVAIAIKKFLKE